MQSDNAALTATTAAALTKVTFSHFAATTIRSCLNPTSVQRVIECLLDTLAVSGTGPTYPGRISSVVGASKW